MARKKTKRNVRINWAKMLLTDHSPWLVSEAYRELRTNVSFSLPGNECKVIGITSPQRAAGKSLTAINFAVAMSEIGKKVLLIDSDLRIPSVALKTGINQEPGLSNVIIGEVPAYDTIMRLKNLHGLSIMPSGAVPPNSTRLLSGSVVGDMINDLKQFFDYIVIDLPPVNPVTDAAILSPLIDGYLLVVRHKQTNSKEVKKMLQNLSIANANILGFVYNDAEIHKHKKGSYYYSYSYQNQ